MFGTATLSVGASAGRPSLVSSLNRKPAIRITPSRWAGRPDGAYRVIEISFRHPPEQPYEQAEGRSEHEADEAEQDDVAAPREAAFGTPHGRGTSAPRETLMPR